MSIKNPITHPSQMPRPLICKPMDSDWVNRQKSMWWSTNFTGELRPNEKANAEKMYLLRDKLLSFGGEQVSMPIMPDMDYPRIMERGQLFYGSSYIRKGLPSQCHYNASRLWEANKGRCYICTGYALSEDGMWREHSWVVQPLRTKYRVWETTTKRVAYFGYVMTDDECEEFAYWNT